MGVIFDNADVYYQQEKIKTEKEQHDTTAACALELLEALHKAISIRPLMMSLKDATLYHAERQMIWQKVLEIENDMRRAIAKAEGEKEYLNANFQICDTESGRAKRTTEIKREIQALDRVLIGMLMEQSDADR